MLKAWKNESFLSSKTGWVIEWWYTGGVSPDGEHALHLLSPVVSCFIACIALAAPQLQHVWEHECGRKNDDREMVCFPDRFIFWLRFACFCPYTYNIILGDIFHHYLTLELAEGQEMSGERCGEGTTLTKVPRWNQARHLVVLDMHLKPTGHARRTRMWYALRQSIWRIILLYWIYSHIYTQSMLFVKGQKTKRKV